ncbi:MAG: hypothetical protein HPY76_04005 [Anaerolineae bacterium]|nr:hypothetical protein [Anaerolineae bacterium]
MLLTAFEGVIAAFLTFFIAADPKNAVLLGRSPSRWLTILALLGAALFLVIVADRLRRSPAFFARMAALTGKPIFALATVGINGLVFAAIVVLDLPMDLMTRLSPALTWLWLGGLQAVLFDLIKNSRRPADDLPHARGWQAVVTVCAILAAAALPMPLQAQANGLPWDTPLEFIGLVFLLPAALILDWRALANRLVLYAALILLLARAVMALALPPVGLEVRAYASPQDRQAGRVVRSYESVFHPGLTSVMTRKYGVTREFPLEFINQDQYQVDSLWLGLDLSGYLALEPDERVVFLVLGDRQARVTLVDRVTGERMPGRTIRSIDEITPELYQGLPALVDPYLQASFTFIGDDFFQVRPLVITPDGAHSLLLESGRAWRAASGALYSAVQLERLGVLSILLDRLFLLVCLGALAVALAGLYRAGRIDPLDLYLSAGALLVFWAANNLGRDQLASLFQPVVMALVVIRVAGLWLAPAPRPARQFWVSVGLVAWVLFLGLYLPYLREVEIFPHGEDNFRSQVIARYIFTSGDFLQLRSQPLVYKFLHPYLVGILHLLFGQSPAAQHVLNAICGVLTGGWLVAILSKRQIPGALAVAAGGLWLVIVSGFAFNTFYFRFGLIEPLAVALLILLILLAIERKFIALVVTGMFLTLLRLDYAIIGFATLWFMLDQPMGDFATVWRGMLAWTAHNWRKVVVMAASLAVLPLGLTALYRLLEPLHQLRAFDTRHDSLRSVFLAWFRVLTGGSAEEVRTRFTQAPLDTVAIILILYLGVVVALLPLVVRTQRMRALDLRWGILVAALFLTYALVRPTGYAPRFSTPLLPLAILALFDSLPRLARTRGGAPPPNFQ